MSPNQKRRLKPLLKKLMMEVKNELNESVFPGIDNKIEKIRKYMDDLEKIINSGKHRKDPEEINLNLMKATSLILDCF